MAQSANPCASIAQRHRHPQILFKPFPGSPEGRSKVVEIAARLACSVACTILFGEQKNAGLLFGGSQLGRAAYSGLAPTRPFLPWAAWAQNVA